MMMMMMVMMMMMIVMTMMFFVDCDGESVVLAEIHVIAAGLVSGGGDMVVVSAVVEAIVMVTVGVGAVSFVSASLMSTQQTCHLS